MPTFFEFFAGGGMVRAGLQEGGWRCVFANDFDRKKCDAYRANWGGAEIVCDDINNIQLDRLPPAPDLIWASFPCQDLSLAGGGAGLRGDRSGTFWPFWKRMEGLVARGQRPTFIVLENVCGTLTSHDGKDFEAITQAFRKLGFRVGAMVIDAERFVPQSRPRLFFIGVSSLAKVPHSLLGEAPHEIWHPSPLKRAYMRLRTENKENWLWWQLPLPVKRTATFADVLEASPSDVDWHSKEETRQLLQMMAPSHVRRVEQAKLAKVRMVGAIYKRTRQVEGKKVVRAEVRFDDVAGCLRTPAGGSSRQTIMVVDGKSPIRTRLISARETARLMGLKDDYKLPARYNEAYHLTGDGVVVDVVEHLSKSIFLPTLAGGMEVAGGVNSVPVRKRKSAKG